MTPGVAWWYPAYRPAEALPQTALGSLFTITGIVRVCYIVSRVTTALGASASVVRYVFSPSSGGADTNLCATASLSGLAAGIWFFPPANTGSATVISPGAGLAFNNFFPFYNRNPTPAFPAGEILLDASGNQTGQVEHYLGWWPMSTDGRVVAT